MQTVRPGMIGTSSGRENCYAARMPASHPRSLALVALLGACALPQEEPFHFSPGDNDATGRIGGSMRRMWRVHNETEQAAIDRGLRWLADQQAAEGAWGSNTPIVLLAFIAHGSRIGAGPYQSQIESAIEWLERQERQRRTVHLSRLEEAFAAWALVDAALLWSDPRVARMAKSRLQRLLRSRRSNGAWWREGKGRQNDVPATCTSMVALQAGVELQVVETRFLDPSLSWLRQQGPSTLTEPGDLASWIWC